MKMNNKKIIVSTLALAMGAALAGSVSGTVAWFQYSTRAQAAFIGTTAHCSEALEIQAVAVGGTPAANGWKTDLNSTTIQGIIDTYNSSAAADAKIGTDLQPITTGELAADAALPASFYKNPIYQFTDKTTWGTAVAANYVQFDLYFHVKDVNNSEAYLAKNLYLTDLTVKAVQSDNSELDLSKAIRVHFASSSKKALFANDGSNNPTISTNVYGSLDLNNNGALDKGPGYEWDNRGAALVYGDSGKTQVANNASAKTTGENPKNAACADDSDPYSIVANQGLLGATTTATDGFKVTVTIWLEGWANLGTKPTGNATEGSAVWDAATYVGKKFQVGMRFACEAHATHA